MAILSALVLISSCGKDRKDSAPVQSTGDSDTTRTRVHVLTDPNLREIKARLSGWERRWATVIPGFTLDSLYRNHPVPFHYAYARLAEEQDLERSGIFGEISPDSVRIVEPDTYRSNEGGVWELWGEPDSAPGLLDLRNDSLAILTTTGPSGGFEEAFWIDRNRFVLVGFGERVFEPWSGGGDLWVIDLSQGTRTIYSTPDVGESAYAKYIEEMRSALRF